MEDFQEFPKCLYLGGNLEAEYVVVFDDVQEADKRALGFAVIGEAVEEVTQEAPRKRGRPAKAE